MENKYFYIILRKASQDLEEIFKYISIDLSNPGAAKKLISEFLEAFEKGEFKDEVHKNTK